jgi:hypothetical protein
LDDKEKSRVKILVKEYTAKDPLEFEEHNHELAALLDKAFVAKFDVKILSNFTTARKINLGLLSLQTFATFASWWEARDVKSGSSTSSESSSSPVKEVSRNIYLDRAKALVIFCLSGKIID